MQVLRPLRLIHLLSLQSLFHHLQMLVLHPILHHKLHQLVQVLHPQHLFLLLLHLLILHCPFHHHMLYHILQVLHLHHHFYLHLWYSPFLFLQILSRHNQIHHPMLHPHHIQDPSSSHLFHLPGLQSLYWHLHMVVLHHIQQHKLHQLAQVLHT